METRTIADLNDIGFLVIKLPQLLYDESTLKHLRFREGIFEEVVTLPFGAGRHNGNGRLDEDETNSGQHQPLKMRNR